MNLQFASQTKGGQGAKATATYWEVPDASSPSIVMLEIILATSCCLGIPQILQRGGIRGSSRAAVVLANFTPLFSS